PAVSVEYEYDANGNVSAVRDSLGGTTSYEYDGAGRLVSVRQSGAGVKEKRWDVAYLPSSSASEVRRFADLAGLVPVATSAFTYSCETCPAGLSRILHRRASGATIH